MSFKIMWMKKNSKYANLQSWYKVKTIALLRDEINPQFTDEEQIVENLEQMLCNDNDNCCHHFKILDDFDNVVFSSYKQLGDYHRVL